MFKKFLLFGIQRTKMFNVLQDDGILSRVGQCSQTSADLASGTPTLLTILLAILTRVFDGARNDEKSYSKQILKFECPEKNPSSESQFSQLTD